MNPCAMGLAKHIILVTKIGSFVLSYIQDINLKVQTLLLAVKIFFITILWSFHLYLYLLIAETPQNQTKVGMRMCVNGRCHFEN